MAQTVYYFDYAAATPVDPRVAAAMKPYLVEKFYNPSSPYAPAIEVRREYANAKHMIAQTIGARADELVMTAGATESINLAINGFGGHKITTEVEHASVKRAISRGMHTFVEVDARGRVDPRMIAEAIQHDTQLVSVALANHEIGTIQPVRDIARVVSDVRFARQRTGNHTPLVFHCDASQGFGLLDIHVGRLGVDLLTLNAAKIYGPKQVGVLWVRPGVQVQAQVVGGGQELGIRSGTENVAGVIGFAEAAQIATNKRTTEVVRLSRLRDLLEVSLRDNFPGAVFSGHSKHRLANFCHVSFPGVDAERLVFLLEAKQVLVATGGACAANSGTRSEVLTAIGLDAQTADGSIRLTLGRETTHDSIEIASRAIIEAVRQELARTGGVL